MNTAEFAVSVEESDDAAATVRVCGDVDVTTICAVRDCLRSVWQRPRRKVIVDLAGVTSADTTLLAALVAARRTAASRHCEFVLQNPNSVVLQLISGTGLAVAMPRPASRHLM